MNEKSPKRTWLALLTYPFAGLMFGLADPLFGQAAVELGAKPGWATAVTVNLALPAVAICLAATYPRQWSALLGAVAMTLGLLVGLAIRYTPPLVAAKPWGLVLAVPPVLVAAGVGYAVLGSLAALTFRARASDVQDG